MKYQGEPPVDITVYRGFRFGRGLYIGFKKLPGGEFCSKLAEKTTGIMTTFLRKETLMETTESNSSDVLVAEFETPTVGELATQALVATAVSIAATALVYGAAYGVATLVGKTRNSIRERRARKELQKVDSTEE